MSENTELNTFELSEEYQALSDAVREFADEEIAPVSAKHDEEHSFPYEIQSQMAEMGLFGLPGEAITVLLTSWLSASAGTGVAVSLLSKGTLNVADITILIPAIFLMGSQLQYMGRLLGVADVPKKYWPLLMAVSIINAVIAMLVMRVIA